MTVVLPNLTSAEPSAVLMDPEDGCTMNSGLLHFFCATFVRSKRTPERKRVVFRQGTFETYPASNALDSNSQDRYQASQSLVRREISTTGWIGAFEYRTGAWPVVRAVKKKVQLTNVDRRGSEFV